MATEEAQLFRDMLTLFNEACRQMSWRFPSGVAGVALPSVPPGWVVFDDFADEQVVAGTLRRRGDVSVFTTQWTLQNVLSMPLLFAGFAYGTARRVPVLSGSFLLDERNFMQNILIRDLRFAGTTLDVLRDSVMETCEPIVSAFLAVGKGSAPNCWASVLDGLNQGLVLAGWTTGRLDAAWQSWDALVEAWEVPARRRPRRLAYRVGDIRDEIAVRASCCLNFTATPGAPITRCATCPVQMPDEERVRRSYEWLLRTALR